MLLFANGDVCFVVVAPESRPVLRPKESASKRNRWQRPAWPRAGIRRYRAFGLQRKELLGFLDPEILVQVPTAARQAYDVVAGGKARRGQVEAAVALDRPLREHTPVGAPRSIMTGSANPMQPFTDRNSVNAHDCNVALVIYRGSCHCGAIKDRRPMVTVSGRKSVDTRGSGWLPFECGLTIDTA